MVPEHIRQKRRFGEWKSTGRKDNYCWVQLAARQPDGEVIRGDFVRLSDENAFVAWRGRFSDVDVFYSICAYAEPDARARYAAPLYFHIRSEYGLDAARKATLAVHEPVSYMLDCRVDSPQFYFDGEDGFDLFVPLDVFDAFYSPWIFRLYAQLATLMDSSEEYVVDQDIYHQAYLWRLPGSRCGDKGLYKVHLTVHEMQELSSEEILAIAASPRTGCPCREYGPDKYAPWWYKCAIRRVARSNPSCLKCSTGTHNHSRELPPCIRALESTALPDGTRHATYSTLASYFAYLNMHYPEIVARLQVIDGRNPIRDPGDIKNIAQFGCRHPSPLPCDSLLRRFCAKGGCALAQSGGDTHGG